jgi:hypothetical protein
MIKILWIGILVLGILVFIFWASPIINNCIYQLKQLSGR